MTSTLGENTFGGGIQGEKGFTHFTDGKTEFLKVDGVNSAHTPKSSPPPPACYLIPLPMSGTPTFNCLPWYPGTFPPALSTEGAGGLRAQSLWGGGAPSTPGRGNKE